MVPVETLGAAADTLDTVTSARMRMSFRGEGGGVDIGLEGEGVIDNEAQLAEFRLRLPCGDMAFITTGARMYVRGPTSPGWTAVDMSAIQAPGGAFSGAPVDPEQLLASLRQVGEVRLVGEESIGGVDTTRYRTTGPPDALMPDGQEGSLDQLRAGGVDPEVTLDVWIDDDGLARRAESSIDAGGVTIVITIELDRFGEPVEIVLPGDDEVVAERSVASLTELSQIGMTFGAECATAVPTAPPS